MAFYVGERQVEGGSIPGVDTVEVRATKGEKGPCWGKRRVIGVRETKQWNYFRSCTEFMNEKCIYR